MPELYSETKQLCLNTVGLMAQGCHTYISIRTRSVPLKLSSCNFFSKVFLFLFIFDSKTVYDVRIVQ